MRIARRGAARKRQPRAPARNCARIPGCAERLFARSHRRPLVGQYVADPRLETRTQAHLETGILALVDAEP